MIKKITASLLVLLAFNSMLGQCWKEVSGGGYDDPSFSLAIKNDGTLWAWGFNNDGELGDGTTIDKTVPTQIGNDTDWEHVSAGNNCSLALKANHTLWAWGSEQSNFPIQIGTDSDWKSIAAGFMDYFAIKNNGTLWHWNYTSPIPIQVGADSNWKTLSSSFNLNHAIKTDGTLWGWGGNLYGGVGDGTTINRFNPVQIGTDSDWSNVSTGYQRGFALKSNGTLWAWDENNYGQLGDGTSINRLSPTQLGSETNWTVISAKYDFTSALKNNGTLWTWGASINSVPTQLGTQNDWSKIYSEGYDYLLLALKTDNTLWDLGHSLQISCSTLNNNHFEKEDFFVVYPNPTNSFITIEMLYNKNSVDKDLRITNPIGQIVYSTKVDKQKLNIPMDNYERGVYFIEILDKSSDNSIIKKVILK